MDKKDIKMIGVNDYLGRYTETLNAKADVDANNFSEAGRDSIINMIMPDYTSEIAMGLPASPLSTTTTTFTCPCDGYILVHADRSTAGNRFYIDLTHNGVTITREGVSYSTDYYDCFMPVAKGTKVRFYTSATAASWSVTRQYFYKAMGATL